MIKPEACLNENLLNEDEFKKPHDSLRSHKAPEFDRPVRDAMKSVYNQVKAPVLHVFNNSIQFGIFPEKMKISKGYSNIKISNKSY